MTATKWVGVNHATDDDHDECFRRYDEGCPSLAEYHFAVADDLGSVEIVHAADNPLSANGIWTLAEIRASGESWRTVAAVAAKMRAAINRLSPSEAI